MRRTSSGRQFPERYLDAMTEITITRHDDIRAVEELKESAKQDCIRNVINQIKSAGYDTPFHFILELMQYTPSEVGEPLKEWLRGDGIVSFIKTCTAHPEFRTSDAFKFLILRLAKLQFKKEVSDLVKLSSFRRPLSGFSADQVSNFSLEHFGNDLHTTAPTLTSLLESLVALPTEASTTTHDGDSDDDSDQDEDSTEPIQSIGSLPVIMPSPQKLRSRRLATQMSMSILLYARSRKLNLVSGLLGYFLYSCRTPKRVIESLHRLGVCISYESVISGMKSIARDSSVELRKLATSLPPLFAYVDNMNFHARVRDQRLDNQAEMQNYTVGYIGLNPHPDGQEMLHREHPGARLDTLGAEHLLPNQANIHIYMKHCWAGISGVLHTYCGSHLARQNVAQPMYINVFKLSKEPTKIFTLPAYDKNEAVIDEITEVLRLVMQELGYTREQLKNRTMPFSGDYLTVRNIRFQPLGFSIANISRIAIARQMESIPRDHLDHFEPMAGMFHLQMAVLNLLFHVHMGDSSDESSLAKWFITLKRDSNIFGTGKRRTIKDFRACNQLFNHVLDAHVLAIVATKLEVYSCAELCKALEQRNWQTEFKKTDAPVLDLNYIEGLRSSDERDRVYENAILFLQHGLIYRDFSDAIRHGDSGRIKNCLTFFMLWFQGSKFSNYAGELLHLAASLNHLWSRDMRESWYRNVLVNFSGSEKSFMAADLLGEFVVREIKSWKTATVTSAGGEYLRTIMAPQVLLCSRIRDKISREIGATQYYKHSTSVDAWYDVRTVANSLLNDRVFTFTFERSLPPRSATPSEVGDLYSTGVDRIWAGRVIEKYIKKRKQGSSGDASRPEELELDGLEHGEDDGEAIQDMMEDLL